MYRLPWLLLWLINAEAKNWCSIPIVPLEIGEWKSNLKHMDSAVVENKPVYISEGQVYVYENNFPGHTIRYINVHNLAMRSCGARAEVKRGGVGRAGLLLVLHAEPGHEIRSVIDVWGTQDFDLTTSRPVLLSQDDRNKLRNMKSLYLFKDIRAIGHNKRLREFVNV